jgi:hypothetical protein
LARWSIAGRRTATTAASIATLRDPSRALRRASLGLDFRSAGRVDRSLMLSLADAELMRGHCNGLIVGPNGVRKTF